MNMNTMNESHVDRDDERRLLKDSVRAFVERTGGASRARALRRCSPGFDRSVWREFADLGWLAVTLPEAYGGLNLSLAEMAIIAEGLGGAVAPEPVIEAVSLAAGVLSHAGGPLAEAILPQVIAGTLIPALAWQESTGSYSPDAVATKVQTDSQGGLSLHGVKAFVPYAEASDGFVVSATDACGLVLFWVPASAAGVTLTHHRLATGASVGRVTFDHVPVTEDNRVASADTAARALGLAIEEATVLASAALVGLMSRVLDITVEYLKVRVQFGRPIGSFQALQHRAVDLYIQRELSNAALADAIKELSANGNSSSAHGAVSRAKARCSDAALLICREAVQMHGAIGFTDEYDLGLYLNRALVYSAWLGNSDHHRRRYATYWKDRAQGVAA